MTSKKKSKKKEKSSYTYPSLHHDVVEAVSDEIPETWYNNNYDENPRRTHSTHVMGKFRCRYDSCPNHGWGSKKVAIVIKGYPGNGYNATVFSQRCRTCNKFGVFTLDEDSYVERIAYRLKKWADLDVQKPPYKGKGGGPKHEDALCEGCRLGVCAERDWEVYLD
ncbi:zinc-binding domain-containing protein [Hypoxylon sp. FL0543]|nr:zinc-binding domain-containing protein [Hypoxylon sp. FL0543]